MNPATNDDDADDYDAQSEVTAEELQAAREVREERAKVARIERQKALRQKVINQLKAFSRNKAGTDSHMCANLESNNTDKDDDERFDYNEDAEQGNEGGPKRKCRACAFKPKEASAVGQYLLQFNRKAFGIDKNLKDGRLHQQIVGGQHWFPTEKVNPVGAGKHSAKYWYLKKIWVYTWQPFSQFGTLCDLKATKCPKGDVAGKLQSKEFDFRVAFMLDKPVILHYRRVLCGACKKSTAESELSFLSNLLTRVSDTLELVIIV